jgi:molecular chaperone DnaK
MPVVGIDLGTTYSAVAYLDDAKKPIVVPNAEGGNFTPSAVYFETSDNIVVGEQAKNVSEVDPHLVVQFVKNFMGKKHTWNIHGRDHRPEIISAMILRKLKADAGQNLGQPITGAVITVPAIFGEAERNATREAAAIAAIEVIDILDEPVAAALSYGLAQRPGTKKGENVLVYDLGGGTFDVTIMRVSENEISMLYTDGDRQLGGKLWDDEIMNHVATVFGKQHGTDPHDDPVSCQTLRNAAEQAKRGLTSKEKTILKCDHAGKSVRIEITRDEFEKMTARLLNRTETVCANTLAKVVEKGELGGWQSIDQILLVGGSSRMPQVPEMVRRLTGKEPKLLDPDLAVAKGAAIYSEMKLFRVAKETGDESALERHGIDASDAALLPRSKVNRVCSFALGTKVLDGDTRKYINSILVGRNAPLPAKGKDSFVTTEDNQRAVRIEILDGEDPDPEHCITIGQGAITNIPAGLPKGSPLDITVELTDESLIHVHAIETTHGTSCTFELKREVGLDKNAIQKASTTY